jgi:hypothetical protein
MFWKSSWVEKVVLFPKLPYKAKIEYTTLSEAQVYFAAF